jgi:type II secretory pathway pseudopilin PulG
MRAASKPLKQRGLIRRRISLNLDGFTIVETMIVLAVSAALFLVAVHQVAGRQNEVEFQQAINDFQSSIKQVISQVNSGDYQSVNNIICQESNGKVVITAAPVGSPPSTEGSNTDCIFAGKVMQFATNTGSASEEYITYPIAGLRTNHTKPGCDDPSTTIDCVNPIVVGAGNNASYNNVGIPDDGLPTYLHNGLEISTTNPRPITFNNGAAVKNVGAFAFMISLGAAPGSQQLYLIPVYPSFHNFNPNASGGMFAAVNQLDAKLASSYDSIIDPSTGNLILANPDYNVKICLESGTTNQSGLVTIGGNGGNVNSVTTTIFSDTSCT